MSDLRFARVLVGVALLVTACGGTSGQGGQSGSDGGQAGGGANGGAGGQEGGTGGGASCASASACGGNIVGTWKVTQSCLTGSKDLGSVCAGASAELEIIFGGTVTYNADGTYSSALTGTSTSHEHYPRGCAPFGLTCNQLAQVATDAGISDHCSIDAAGTCNCDSMAPATAANTPGTYSTSGGTLTTVHAGATSTSSYCVQGGVLHEIAVPGDGGLTSTGGIVLARQ